MSKLPVGASLKAASAFDWDEIHRQLDGVKQTIADGRRMTEQEKREVLHQRAEALAREPFQAAGPEHTLEVVEFVVAHEHYGFELTSVREIYPLKDLTPLPGAAAFILGITNIRGQVLSVIDLKKLFGLPDKGLTDFNKIIIICNSSGEIGILADAVLGLKSVSVSEIQPSLPILTGIRKEFLRGVTRESMVLLDANPLLASR